MNHVEARRSQAAPRIARVEASPPDLEHGRLLRRKAFNHFMTGLLASLSVMSVAVLLIIVLNILENGAGVISLEFFTQPHSFSAEGGIAHAIAGTFAMMLVTALVAVPLGILVAVYLAEFGQGWFADAVRFIVDLLLQMPSIVVGIFIWATLVQCIGFSGLAGSIALMVIMTPIVVRAVEEVLRLVPDLLREAGWALGVPRWRVVLGVVIPTVRSGIVTGVILATARAAGETAPILLTALGSNFFNQDLTRPTAAVPLLIYNYASQPSPALIEKAWGAALVLIIVVAFFNAAVRTFAGSVKRDR